MMAGKVVGLGFEIISKFESYFLMTVIFHERWGCSKLGAQITYKTLKSGYKISKIYLSTRSAKKVGA